MMMWYFFLFFELKPWGINPPLDIFFLFYFVVSNILQLLFSHISELKLEKEQLRSYRTVRNLEFKKKISIRVQIQRLWILKIIIITQIMYKKKNYSYRVVGQTGMDTSATIYGNW